MDAIAVQFCQKYEAAFDRSSGQTPVITCGASHILHGSPDGSPYPTGWARVVSRDCLIYIATGDLSVYGMSAPLVNRHSVHLMLPKIAKACEWNILHDSSPMEWFALRSHCGPLSFNNGCCNCNTGSIKTANFCRKGRYYYRNNFILSWYLLHTQSLISCICTYISKFGWLSHQQLRIFRLDLLCGLPLQDRAELGPSWIPKFGEGVCHSWPRLRDRELELLSRKLESYGMYNINASTESRHCFIVTNSFSLTNDRLTMMTGSTNDNRGLIWISGGYEWGSSDLFWFKARNWSGGLVLLVRAFGNLLGYNVKYI